MKNSVYNHILKSKEQNKKLFAVLIDPDKFNQNVITECNKSKVDFIFIGGSGLQKGKFHKCLDKIKQLTEIPLVIFPGGREQISEKADAILLLSLISGRNPDYLIGEHVRASKRLKKSKLEIISTGYILIDGDIRTSTQNISRTFPIKRSNIPLITATALAGELLGMKLIYLEAGSGAKKALPPPIINAVKKNISLPLIAGGGVNSPEKAKALCKAGADVIVVGNAIEKNIALVSQIASAIK